MQRQMRRLIGRVIGSGLLGLALAACAAGGEVWLLTPDGSEVAPLQVSAGHLRVLLFVTPDCPIANSYAPEIEALAQELRGSEVELLLVHVDPDVTPASAAAHARDYGLTLPVALDPRQVVARAVGATVTPEAAVLDNSGVRYLGRIDDRWRGLGQDSQVAEHRDLRDAISALRQGRDVATAHAPAIGCLLPEPRR